MGTLYALVLTVAMSNGDYQDVVLDVYGSEQQCESAKTEQHVSGACHAVDGVIHSEDIPEEIAKH
ncbi:DUF1482 family protein [Trabulsiella odontotermitis]|uniref:DUF1482 domain-containing protein n=1 Tax=Trabulsiella odontotermitis TaxID=379893 RepID=A0A0L0GXK2_9ENTR|nr:DUF1482 family protein [Trabulsiella odontotermitis]KNC93642.1 hypothetical protein GM31_18860 [Trabulsiella odontotermitis]